MEELFLGLVVCVGFLDLSSLSPFGLQCINDLLELSNSKDKSWKAPLLGTYKHRHFHLLKCILGAIILNIQTSPASCLEKALMTVF